MMEVSLRMSSAVSYKLSLLMLKSSECILSFCRATNMENTGRDKVSRAPLCSVLLRLL